MKKHCSFSALHLQCTCRFISDLNAVALGEIKSSVYKVWFDLDYFFLLYNFLIPRKKQNKWIGNMHWLWCRSLAHIYFITYKYHSPGKYKSGRNPQEQKQCIYTAKLILLRPLNCALTSWLVTNMHVQFRKGGVRAMCVQYIERHLLGYKKLQWTEAVTEHWRHWGMVIW